MYFAVTSEIRFLLSNSNASLQTIAEEFHTNLCYYLTAEKECINGLRLYLSLSFHLIIRVPLCQVLMLLKDT